MGYPVVTIGDVAGDVAKTGPAHPDVSLPDPSPATIGAGGAVAVVVLGMVVGALGLWAWERRK